MVEFHRYGRSAAILSPDVKYIRACGWGDVSREISPTLDHEQFLRNLALLRYEHDTEVAQVAMKALAHEAHSFLPELKSDTDGLLQIDLVTNAAELWAFPFEACFARNKQWLDNSERGVVLTRRIRGDFLDQAPAWPDRPKILFVRAPATKDLEQDLIDQHIAALEAAVQPWIKGNSFDDVLVVREITSVAELRHALEEAKASYVHILAHGAVVPDPLLDEKKVWGLRLGYEGDKGTSPQAIAEPLVSGYRTPLVVSVAACDSANQASSAFGAYSLVQELHRRGVPVVVGSQLPLTKPGSVTLTREFYERLLRADDVRLALHAARVALTGDKAAGHDWLSIVSYVRLPPEGYTQYLMEFGLRAELAMLKAAQSRADVLFAAGGPPDAIERLVTLLRVRLAELEKKRQCLDPQRKDLAEECLGLLASANKRLAELLFRRSLKSPETAEADRVASRQALAAALEHYRRVYQKNFNQHWHGIQQIALDAALNGVLEHRDWDIVLRAAELARDANKQEVWACGTIAEARLLAVMAGRTGELDIATQALAELKKRAGTDEFPMDSTRRQIARYVDWWTNGNGFFPNGEDVAAHATELLASIK
jgi:CHAT domain